LWKNGEHFSKNGERFSEIAHRFFVSTAVLLMGIAISGIETAVS
jgi:hypothetical protein